VYSWGQSNRFRREEVMDGALKLGEERCWGMVTGDWRGMPGT
jgi:hypothetical protein